MQVSGGPTSTFYSVTTVWSYCPFRGPPPIRAPPGPVPVLASQIPFCKPQLLILIPFHSCTDGRVAPSCLTCIDHCSNGGSCTMNSKMMPECQ